MRSLRALIRTHCTAAVFLLALALCFRALVPAGFMVASSQDKVLVVSVCSGAHAEAGKISIPLATAHGEKDSSGDPRPDQACAFTVLAKAALEQMAAGIQGLAVAWTLLVGLGLAAALLLGRMRQLRPPLRGPPLGT